jgi:hypothetical protein
MMGGASKYLRIIAVEGGVDQIFISPGLKAVLRISN